MNHFETNISGEYPLISFVMPCYQDGKTVARAINSIFDNDWPEIEVIAVNDGSSDDTKKVLDGLKKHHKRLTVVHFKENKGACVARNHGAKIAKGKYLAWLPADAFIYPGMVRVWVDILEKNPDYDFMYGGYRFVDDQGTKVFDYWSDLFDPHILETTNYIDGSFPIKTSTFWRVAKEIGQEDGLWDANIKSLQDWDFWLSVVRHGGKGIYYKDIFFETYLPHPGGLSDDSHRNWLARTRAVKAKQGIKERNVCVTAPGAPFFAKYLSHVLDADYKEMPQAKDHAYDLIYELGFYPSIAEHCASVFVHPQAYPAVKQYVDQGLDVPLAPAVKAVHLIGTDLLQMQELPKSHLKIFQHFLNEKYDFLFVEYPEAQKEATALGLNAEVLPLPPRKYFEETPFPEKFTVAVYTPTVNQSLYCVDDMKKVAELCPDFEFLFFGGQKQGKEGNITHLGYVQDMTEVINASSCLLRITLHDGLPQGVLEFLSAGRRVVWNHELEHVHQAWKSVSPKMVAKAVKEESQKGSNHEAAQWVREHYSQDEFRKRIMGLLNYDAKRYWEHRAPAWILQAERFYTTKDWPEIEPHLGEFTSVIDIGCGDGQWAKHFDGKEYLGVDISERLITYAKSEHPNNEFMVSSLQELNIDRKFDLAFCYTLFLHIPDNEMEQAVRALKKFAKRAVIIEPKEVVTHYYQHAHNYEQWFTIESQVEIGARKLLIVSLS